MSDDNQKLSADIVHKDALDILVLLGKCHMMLQDFSASLRKHPQVDSVIPSTDLYAEPDFFRLTEFRDAELKNGQAISWRLEVALASNRFQVESDVTLIHEQGQDTLKEIAECEFANFAEGMAGLEKIVKALCDGDPISAIPKDSE